MKPGLIPAACLLALSAAAPAQRGTPVVSKGNPILSDGRYYSTDPAPLVDGDTLWILAGRDEAPADVNDFIMKEWQLLSTTDPASGKWTHHPAIARPEAVFEWAEPGRAYAGQIVKGANGKFYLYAPVLERGGAAKDRFAIGVAVADTPVGPWTDAHPAGPIVSQRTPQPNDIQNIDPSVLVDDDGRVYLYWGTFGQMRAIELERDMVTTRGTQKRIDGVDGFFEAPWLMKRNGTYYLLYAANNAGPDSACTPAVYHACIAYSTATSPMGPWTYRGVMLKPVSSTTSHPGAVAFKGKWYLAYHTADAAGGGHFRRSVALDRIEWDDSVTPARIRMVVPTRLPQPAAAATRNVAGAAVAAASNEPIPVQYWIRALNDGIVKNAPLPPDMWGNWNGAMPARSWIEYRWAKPVTINGSRIWFHADQPAGSGVGVAPPRGWRIEYWDSGTKAWKPMTGASGYGTTPGAYQDTSFAPVTTRCVRATFDASAANGTNAAVAVQEWQVLAPTAARPVTPGRGSAIAPCG
ncbi:glycosyl hydrolase family 43 [Sphingomonas sp. Leaf412]|uniref:family 43 glycosylhydrolase n=1 Tax=Sphingomonas sp. Leaf412 TaxID=1736370 RepID=UPI0006F7BCF4|nr:family 43 glycosylhydrolase [Sphingomonas sp. Leaf412]KQT33626.1 glycosyl hydrolase family 43 [Sphingomonas sp. Leaf412]